MLYYSASFNAFYDTDIHGTRTIMVDDPSWQRPLTDVTLEPEESYVVNDEIVRNDSDQALVLHSVLDWYAQPNQIEIINTDCKIPNDAIEITAAEHAELMSAQSEGLLISSDEDGKPTAVEPPPPTQEAILLAQIANLEKSITPRRLREALLGTDNGWLAGLEAQITTLRSQL